MGLDIATYRLCDAYLSIRTQKQFWMQSIMDVTEGACTENINDMIHQFANQKKEYAHLMMKPKVCYF